MIMNIFEWMEDVERFGWSPAAYRDFRELLRPDIRFSRPIRWPGLETDAEKERRDPQIKDFVEWEIALCNGDHVRVHLSQIQQLDGWSDALVSLLPDFTSLLKNVLELMAEVGSASEKHDLSYIHRPSISDHPQNLHHQEWSILVDLCRDAWLETAKRDVGVAAAEFIRWKGIKYPLFRRLCLFGAQASQDAVSVEDALELFAEERCWWMWSVETQREALRLICALAARLTETDADRLTDMVLRGPPRDMFRAELDEPQWQQIRTRTIWLRLAKFANCGGHLGNGARAAYAAASNAHPDFALEPDERDEFPMYISSGWGEGWRRHVTLPQTRPELAAALRIRPVDDFFYEDNWRNLLETKFPVAITALLQLAQEHTWPKSAWQEALQYLSDEKFVRKAWYPLHNALATAPAGIARLLAPSLTWWLQSAANALPTEAEAGFLELIDKILEDHGWEQTEPGPIAPAQAINHPLGHLTEALLRWWYRAGPKVGELLPAPIRERFTRLITDEQTTGASRVILAAHLANLFIVDPRWTTQYLLPYFAWNRDSSTARHVWEAYLGNPTISAELVGGFKKQFLETAKHYEALDDYGGQYAGLLAIALLELPDAISRGEARIALQNLGTRGLAEAARRIAAALANAGERCEEYWTNRVKPLLQQAWPKSAVFRSSAESCQFAEICIRASQKFEDALNCVLPWLRTAPECRQIAIHLSATKIPEDSPALALRLLAAIVDTHHSRPPRELKSVLDTIARADRTVKSSEEFKRLCTYVEQFSLK